MIDAIYKPHLDKMWDHLGRLVARAGISANAVTWIGLILGAANALWYVYHENGVLFGLTLALTELLDNLDGAVARVTGRSSHAGAFLDAWTDRYKEAIPLFAVAHVTGYWPVCFIVIAGSLIVSYSHARAAMEGPAATPARSGGLPDLFERFERVAALCIGLVFGALLPSDLIFGHDVLFVVLWVLAVMTHVTAVQRFARSWRALSDADRTP